jgi:hypothetical protein
VGTAEGRSEGFKLDNGEILARGVTPWCYCGSYSTSIVASTVFILWWLPYKPNSMKMLFSTNGVGSF